MLFAKSNVICVQVVAVIAALLFTTGCIAAETTSDSTALSENVVQNVAGVETIPNQVQDQQALADYQLQLSDAQVPAVESREAAIVKTTSDQVANRQALAEYQLQLGDSVIPQLSARIAAVVRDEHVEQIADFQALAEYQMHLSDIIVPAPINQGAISNSTIPNQIADQQALAVYQAGMNETTLSLAAVSKTASYQYPDQIADRQALAAYQLHLSDTQAPVNEYLLTAVNPILPNQISDFQALAEYEFQLSDGGLAR